MPLWSLARFLIFSDRYRECFNRLKDMKQEIEHIQHITEKDRLQMLKDFDDWWEQQSEQVVRVKLAAE